MVIRELFAKLGLQVDESAFKAADAAIGAVKGGLLGIGAAVAAARVALAGMVKATADYASEIHDLSAATGVGTEALQVLGYAGKLAGVGMEEVAHGLAHLSRSAYEASTSGGAAGEAFYRLGINVLDSSGKIKDINQLLPEISAALGKVTNPTERTALSMQLLGRAGARLTQTLTKFGGDMEAVKKEAVSLGIVLDEKTIKAGDELGDTLDRVNFALKGVIYAIGTPLLGRVRTMAEGWVRWISVHRQWIALKVHEAIGHVAVATNGLYMAARAIAEHPTLLKWLIGVGVAAAAIMFPLTALSLLIAGIAEDVALFFQNPKADTLTRDLVEGFNDLKKAIGIEDWFEAPVTNMMKTLSAFFDWVVDQAGQLTERVARAMSPSSHASLSTEITDYIKYTVAQILVQTARTPGARNLGMHALRSVEADMDQHFAPGAAFRGTPGDADIGYTNIDGTYYPYPKSELYGSGRGVLAPEFNPSMEHYAPTPMLPVPYAPNVTADVDINVTVNAGPGADGQKIGDELGPVLRSQVREVVFDSLGDILAEAQAATHR